MSSVLEINGKEFYSITKVVKEVSYSRDYITRLAREKKIVASYVGRQWFIDLRSLRAYIKSVSDEQAIRKQQLSEERRQDLLFRNTTLKKDELRLKSSRSVGLRSFATTLAVLGFGVLVGSFIYNTSFASDRMSILAVVSNGSLNEVFPAQVSSTEVVDNNTDVSRVNSRVASSSASILSDNKASGILLFPGATATITDLFSDQVMVDKMPDGTTVVFMIDSQGNKIGNNVPFVVVPLSIDEENSHD